MSDNDCVGILCWNVCDFLDPRIFLDTVHVDVESSPIKSYVINEKKNIKHKGLTIGVKKKGRGRVLLKNFVYNS